MKLGRTINTAQGAVPCVRSFYLRNLQGDITAILNDSGAAVVTYSYKILSIGGSMAATLGIQNPFRYRGYVYDQETGLYYLQTRCYDPELGRFISADCFASTGQGFAGDNMFAYCLNNPVILIDRDGQNQNMHLTLMGMGSTIALFTLTHTKKELYFG